MLNAMDIFTFLLLGGFAFYHGLRLLRTGKPCSFGLVSIIIFIAYGLPIFYRHIWGPIGDDRFAEALESASIRLRADCFVVGGILILWFFSRKSVARRLDEISWYTPVVNMRLLSLFSAVSWLILFLPMPGSCP